jgi:purine-nucleoside phosphorylase
VLIDRALRDEGTSYHYLASADYAHIPVNVLELMRTGLSDAVSVVQGGVWTTDAPFRETEEAIAFARSENLLAVEMEAAALYAFAEARNKPVVCFAHVTNAMATVENDFEKGEGNGNEALTTLIAAVARLWRAKT